MFAPLLSEFDPKESQEGYIDPIGLYTIADALAVRLAPGVRERQSHPRFLTVMAVSHAVCSSFEEDRVAKDGVSEPWQVFEWYFVEGLVRSSGMFRRHVGVPGSEKVTAAVRAGVPVSASRYLKTPGTFGFHGVYRTLARELRVETLNQLGEAGYEILAAWSAEQNLPGFDDSSEGDGSRWRTALFKAVDEGLSKGHTCRSAAWEGWNFMMEHLAPGEIGKKEGKAIVRALLSDTGGFRKNVVKFLASSEGRKVLLGAQSEGFLSEKKFHRGLSRCADGALCNLLEVIRVYEQFSRLLQDAFDDCLYEMSRSKRRLSSGDFCSCKGVAPACERIPDLYVRLLDMLAPYGLSTRLQEMFEDLSDRLPAQEWTVSLLEHHRLVQKRKPPHGKAPWFERFDDGSYLIRPGYVRDTPGLHMDEYVHDYRTKPLRAFAQDLGLVK